MNLISEQVEQEYQLMLVVTLAADHLADFS